MLNMRRGPVIAGISCSMNTSRNLSFGIATYQYRRFVSVPEYSHWQGLFLRKTGGTEQFSNIPNYITLHNGYNIRNHKFRKTREGITAIFPGLEPEYKLLPKDLPLCAKNGAAII